MSVACKSGTVRRRRCRRAPHATLTASLLAAAGAGVRCDRPPSAAPTSVPAARTIVCTFYPVYLLTMNLAAGIGDLRVELLAPAALGCPHDYDPSPSDIRRVAGAAVLVTHGGVDAFARRLADSVAGGMPVITASESCTTLPTRQWHAEASPPPPAGADDHANHDHHDHAALAPEGVNPHAWVSPAEYVRQVEAVAAALGKRFPQHAAAIAANAADYRRRLAPLTAQCERLREEISGRRVAAHHGVFDYLARDLGLIVSGYIEDAPGAEPSAGHVARLVDRLRRDGVAAILVEPYAPRRLADAVAREAGATVVVLDPVASGPERPAADAYERVQAENLAALRGALSRGGA